MSNIANGWEKRIATLYECNYERATSFEEEFKKCELVNIKSADYTCQRDEDAIVICVVKDDLTRIIKFIDHYRSLGVSRFAFVDNNSTDGTYEYILSQNDCDLYLCRDQYSSLRRVVWLNKLISIYGYKCWYIMVDSDEFIFYHRMEKMKLNQLIQFAELNKISRISGFLVDMYPKGRIFELSNRDYFIEEYRYFDTKGYDIHNTNYGVSIIGGPRKRVFGTENELAKCPIFKLSERDIVASAHFLLPRIKAKENPIWLAIGHYKFLDEKDIQKIDNAVRDENYACGSREYKLYQEGIRRDKKKSLYNSSISNELNNSDDLKKLPYINPDFGEWNENK